MFLINLQLSVREACGGLWPFARAVGGRAGAWERLPRVLEAAKAARCGRTSIFLLGRAQPCRLCRKRQGRKWQVKSKDRYLIFAL